MVLGAQFNSFIHPFTVLLALPFSVTGAFLALRLTGISLNIYSMIGLLLLMGIVKKNSILLVDFTNERRLRGDDVRTALLHACPMRLRPILMTSVATIVGAIPAAMALGPGAETTRPMAVVVIGGVLLSTVLTLVVVPCAYSLLARWESHKHDQDLQDALRALGEVGPREAVGAK
jgi:HAE1 family hydrophobic/amphiphilic exporter-1